MKPGEANAFLRQRLMRLEMRDQELRAAGILHDSPKHKKGNGGLKKWRKDHPTGCHCVDCGSLSADAVGREAK